ncbi:HAMP domain-containing sensor histidine kinase [Actinomadura vinacea]|uniref:sensor histidine kinase n=1 Tax=Actinomadura vinacea TaxID=115336 RepID=UPI0031CE04BD
MRWSGRVGDLSIRGQITFWSIAVSAVVAVVLYLVILALLRHETNVTVRHDLASAASRTIARTAVGRIDPGRAGTDLLQAVDTKGKVIAYTDAMAGYPPVRFPPPGPGGGRVDGHACGIRAPDGPCYIVVAYRFHFRGSGERVVYALAPAPQLFFAQPAFSALMAGGIPLLSGLIGYAMWRTTGRLLRPVDDIQAELDEITATDLQRRVPVKRSRDEIARLAESVNATLDRLESAAVRLRGFVSDASHELRSPLTGLRTELELALSDPEGTDHRTTLRTLLATTERLNDVLDDLLALARLDAAPQAGSEKVELHALAALEITRRHRRARFVMEAGERVIVHGSALELGRLLTNLLDNADRHATAGVRVSVGTERSGTGGPDTAVVEVVDDGPGIAPEDRERVFERFARLAHGRRMDAGGTGLGLAISRGIAVAHGGSLEVTDRPDGLSGARFVLRLPLAPSS